MRQSMQKCLAGDAEVAYFQRHVSTAIHFIDASRDQAIRQVLIRLAAPLPYPL